MEKELRCLNETERKIIDAFVKELRERLGDEIVSIRLFGSKARGNFSEDSDIDIFVLVKEKTPDIKEKVSDLAADYILDYDIPLSVGLCDLFENEKRRGFFCEPDKFSSFFPKQKI